MANSVRPIGKSPTIEKSATVVHAASQKTYVASPSGQRRTNQLGDTYEVSATHTIGSGKNARSYLHLGPNGELTQLPLSWYTQEVRWAMSPGFDTANHADFARVAEGGCLFCHTSAPQKLDEGVDCQRCHGPGGDHVNGPGKTNITRYGGQDTCLQCHLQSTSDPLPHALPRVGKQLWSYRAGEALSETVVHFQEAANVRSAKFEINSHGYRLLQSPCFVKSAGRLDCIRCHDPHGEPAATAVRDRARTVCAGCHRQPHRDEAAHADCTGCHMPRRQTQDAVHVVMTDHLIGRRVSEAGRVPHGGRDVELLDKVDQPDLYLGLAYLRGGRDVARGLELLSRIGTLPREATLAMIEAGALGPEGISPATAEEELVVGEALLTRGRLDDAALHLRRAVSLPRAKMGLAFVAVRQGKRDEAARMWRAAAESAPLRVDALTALSRLALEQGNAASALRDAREAVAFEPNSAEANLALSRALAASSNLTEAVMRALRAVRMDPKLADARYNYGRMLQATGAGSAVILEQFETCIALDPKSWAAHLSLGVTLARSGETSRAAKHFRAALALKPDLEEAKRNLRLVESAKPEPAPGAIVSEHPAPSRP